MCWVGLHVLLLLLLSFPHAQLMVVPHMERRGLFQVALFSVTVSPVDDNLRASGFPVSLDEAVRLIQEECDTAFLDGIRESGGGFLYRGLPPNTPTNRPCVFLDPESDLLDPATYMSTNAADFFAHLDETMASLNNGTGVRPMNGHLATPKSRAASAWGPPASIWPLGKVHWAFVKGSNNNAINTLFWPPISSSFNNKVNLMQEIGLVIDKDLGVAIRDGDEVLFTSENIAENRRLVSHLSTTPGSVEKDRSRMPKPPERRGRGPGGSFLAIPLSLEGELRAELDALPCKLALGLG